MAKAPVLTKSVDVDHPNFRSWFGNSVAHDEGTPRRYFTGTSKDVDFPDFKVSRHGAWFTTDPKEASSYAEQNDSQGYKLEGIKVRQTNTASRVIPAYLRAENPYTGSKPDYLFQSENYKKAQSDWFDTLRAQGYDSWIPESQGGNLAVILGHPGQIKSAVSNTGDFDPNQKRIDRADGGALADDEGITAYHGSPHDFEQFDTSKIGTGEGAQAYGHGLYFAENESVAKGYRDALSHPTNAYPGALERVMQKLMDAGVSPMDAEIMSSFAWEGGFNPEKDNIHEHFKQFQDDDDEYDNDFSHHLKNPKVVEALHEYTRKPTPRMYEVHINAHPDHILDWDKPLHEQSDHVKRALSELNLSPATYGDSPIGAHAYAEITKKLDQGDRGFLDEVKDHPNILASSPELASSWLASRGIKGIKYLDAGSRGQTDEPTRNYVVFNHDHVKIRRKYEQGGAV
jgi:hypothetical protein